MKKLLTGALVVGALAAVGSVLPDSASKTSSAPTPSATTASCEAAGTCGQPADAVQAQEQDDVSPTTALSPTSVPAPPAPARTAATAMHTSTPLLFAAAGGDGDSWKDTQGREYRMGLINTPEYNECYGSVATAKRKSMVANGFRALVYSTDTYGRRVSVITTASGVNLNIYLARHGYANDKYVAEFRHENPSLATKLDAAFAAAKREKAGLWGACSTTGGAGGSTGSTGATTSASCHPDYKTCIPIKGDGSGNGSANDLDCGDIRKVVYLRQVGVDPYRLDNNGDGVGCESYA